MERIEFVLPKDIEKRSFEIIESELTEKIDEKIFLNPGSISLPKENFENSYGVFQEDYFIIKNLEEKIIKKFKL